MLERFLKIVSGINFIASLYCVMFADDILRGVWLMCFAIFVLLVSNE